MRLQLEESLRQYHERNGFVVYKSFPLLTSDPTVLFTNATITPFKHFFENPQASPHNYALIQRCLRVGGGAGNLHTAIGDPNYSSLFDMFGCGLFNCSYPDAAIYFVALLSHMGFSKSELRFVVPEQSNFTSALLAAGINETAIAAIRENGEFWQDWRFGKNGLLGRGLTAMFARGGAVGSAVEMAADPSSFVELGNLIHVYGRAQGEEVLSIPHEGFDVGIGMGRLLIALTGKTLYELSPLSELAEVVATFFRVHVCCEVNRGTVRMLTDHLCSIGALIQEGVRPGKKRHAFVLRKLARMFLESLWSSADKIIPSAPLVSPFMDLSVPGSSAAGVEIIAAEEQSLLTAIRKGKELLKKDPSLTPDILLDTYGVRLHLLRLST